MSYYEHILFEDEILGDNSSESGSGDFGAEFDVPCDRAVSHEFSRIFLPAVYGVIFLLGTVGNALVVAVMGFQRRSRTMTDKYRLHLSVADLLFVLTLPFWAADAASDWYFGGFMCVAVHMIYTVNLYSSVLILAFISVDRYLAVVRATSSQDARKVLAQRVIYAGVWLPALLLTVPDLVFAKAEDVTVRTICERIYPPDSAVAWLVAFRVQHILVGFVVPGLVILTCYCVIIARLSSGTKGTQKRKALKTTVVLIVCFFGCWLPYCAGILVDTLLTLGVVAHSCALEQGLEKWISVTEALAYFHCCLNPILYAFLGAKFKKSARNALSPSRGSSLKILSRRRAGVPSISTESESSSFHSS
ncbi:C-X-C chemokine receptor type 4a [Denticeps clupeoides]|uniref:G-protein coupled receptors family 1 profile domain-containing protein n=1 Tax=Denticeps clupeoides TaxID=299321 RepID=A0AAY4AIY4_9TELE|nr:C-X-C chemokine receptor type 4-B-like [Denticeps clupeoides]